MHGMSVDVKKKFAVRSERVKAVDLHPTEPWLLCALYSGQLIIYNFTTEQVVRQWEVSTLPLRCAKFIARKQWVIVGADDMTVRIFNFNTGDLVKRFEAHQDYLRNIAIHPTLSFVLTCSDDMSIKLWDWDKDWSLVRLYEGHTHYVMGVAFNPKDPNTFASASLDKTIKVWGLSSSNPHFTLEGRESHAKGVNCVAYYPGGDKPYLVSGSDDKKVKVWDYVNKSCVQTLEAHQHNVGSVVYHPSLPLLVTASEDGVVILWNSNTYRLEKPLNYGWDRAWSLAVKPGSNHVAIGFDDGAMMIKLGREVPAASMDATGKIIYAKHSEMYMAQLKALAQQTNSNDNDDDLGAPVALPPIEDLGADGTPLPMVLKELGACEVYPQEVKHSPNGRLCAVIGDGEYTIYMAIGWRNKAFGQGLELVWGRGKGQYAVREANSKISVFKDFKESLQFRPDFTAEGIFGGLLIGVKGRDCVCFYDWEHGVFIKQIDAVPKQLYWSESGDRVVIATDTSFFVLTLNKAAVMAALDNPQSIPPEGIENAFLDDVEEVSEKVRTGVWVGDCFIYTNGANKLNYAVGGRVETVAHLDKSMYLLGYMPRSSRVMLMDKAHNVCAYQLNLATINYQTAVLRKDFAAAERLLPKIAQGDKLRIALFLEQQGHIKQALKLSPDLDHRFDLALALNDLPLAARIAEEEHVEHLKANNISEADGEGEVANEHKWKQIADLAIRAWDFALAEKALWRARDLNGLLLLYSSTGDAEGTEKLKNAAIASGQLNVALLALVQLGRVEELFDLFVQARRLPEAAMFARAYKPSLVPRALQLWREELAKTNVPSAQSLADPQQFPNLFPQFDQALLAEARFKSEVNAFSSVDDLPAASSYLQRKSIVTLDALQLLSQPVASTPPSSPPSKSVLPPNASSAPSTPLTKSASVPPLLATPLKSSTDLAEPAASVEEPQSNAPTEDSLV